MSKGLFPALGGEINSVIWKTSPPTWVVSTLSGPGAELHGTFRGCQSLRLGGEDGAPEKSQDTPSRGAWAPAPLPSTLDTECNLQTLLKQTSEEVSASAIFTYGNTRRAGLGFLVKLGFPILHQEHLPFSFPVCFSTNQFVLSNTARVSRKLWGYSLTHIPAKL